MEYGIEVQENLWNFKHQHGDGMYFSKISLRKHNPLVI